MDEGTRSNLRSEECVLVFVNRTDTNIVIRMRCLKLRKINYENYHENQNIQETVHYLEKLQTWLNLMARDFSNESQLSCTPGIIYRTHSLHAFRTVYNYTTKHKMTSLLGQTRHSGIQWITADHYISPTLITVDTSP